jgi:predicted RNA-binding Zn-ribbon protein involved in translation (DUF1610 family)
MCFQDISLYLLHINKVVILLPFSLNYEVSKLPEALAKKDNTSQQVAVTELDLTKIEGNGDFSCPKCGVIISPEDESEEVYVIVEEKVKDDVLEELTIQCNACSCRIRLTGFPALDMTET